MVIVKRDGRLGRAALDVFVQEPTPPERWVDVPGTVLTPHSAGGTVDSLPRMVAQALDNIERRFEGRPLSSPVPG